MKAHDGMYIDGAVAARRGRTTDRGGQPGRRAGHRPGAGRHRGGRRRRRAGRTAALPGWAATAPAERAALLAALRDVLAARRDEIAETVTAELGAPLAFAAAVHADMPDRGRRHLRRTRRRRTPSRRGSATRPVLPRAGGRRRRDHAVELPAAPDRRQGRPRARRRLHRRAQARRGHPAGRPALRRGRARGRAARRGVQPRHRPRPGRRARRWPRTTGVDLVSFTGSTAVGRQIGATAGGGRQARRPRTGRQVRQRHPARAPTSPRRSTSASPTSSPTPARRAAPGPGCWSTPTRYDEAVALAAAAAAKYVPGERLGPVVNAKQRDRVRGYIEKGVEEGARLVAGGPEAPEGRSAATTSARPSSPTSPRR